MAYFKRQIDLELLKWKKDKNHKPLLLRGARQVGKSTAVRQLGKSFDHFIELNLEQNSDLQELFGGNLDIEWICNQISIYFKTPIIPNKTLLFIDEIQVSARAIASLRYFYEKMPQLHVVAAGSLLEFALNDLPSFGVGRIRSIFLYPFSFDEFLLAQGYDMLVKYKRLATPENPLSTIQYRELVKQLRTFYVIGGMPEAVQQWVSTHDYARCAAVHNDILLTYQDDFKKYKSRILPEILRNTMLSVALQAGTKFVFSQVDDNVETRTVKQALELLTLAGLIFPVTHTSANGIPLGAEVNHKFRKYLFLDIGLLQSLLQLDVSENLLADEVNFVNKGGISEMFAGLELIKYSSCEMPAELFYWQRSERNALAEVDYILNLHGKIVPLEIKSGTSGSMQSLRIFMETKKSEFGIRSSLENFGTYQSVKILPLFALSNLQENFL